MTTNSSIAVTVGLALLLGLMIGLAPGRWDLVIVLAAVVLAAAVLDAVLRPPPARVRRPRLTARQALALVALYLVLASTLVFRERSADQLAANPLDLAGSYRVLCLGAAFATACVSMLAARLSVRRVPWPARLYTLYIVIIPLGALTAISPGLVLFKWAEMVTLLVVWFALVLAFPDQMDVPIRHFGIFIGALAASVIAGVVLFPDLTLIPVVGAFPIQVAGHLPDLSSNDVGALGVVVLVFGLGRRRISGGVVALGGALIIAAQYRTGYVAALVLVVVVLVLRRHAAARGLLVALAVALPVAAQTTDFQDAWVRGESSQTLSTLTGRTVWWGDAIHAAQRSPVIGLGLSSGTRFEVLQAQFNGLTSTIHSTWVEAYVGTGLLGVTVLAGAVISGAVAAWRRARYDGYLLPLLVLTLVLVRSITSSTVDIGGITVMLFLLALSASQERPPPAEAQRATDAVTATA